MGSGVWAIMQFVFMPIMGSMLTDSVAAVILLSNFGPDWITSHGACADLAWLFVGRVISGITAASISTSMAMSA